MDIQTKLVVSSTVIYLFIIVQSMFIKFSIHQNFLNVTNIQICKLPKSANVISCQFWQILSTPKLDFEHTWGYSTLLHAAI